MYIWVLGTDLGTTAPCLSEWVDMFIFVKLALIIASYMETRSVDSYNLTQLYFVYQNYFKNIITSQFLSLTNFFVCSSRERELFFMCESLPLLVN